MKNLKIFLFEPGTIGRESFGIKELLAMLF